MAHKLVEKDGVEYIAQEIMRVGAGVYCRILAKDRFFDGLGGGVSRVEEKFDWMDAAAFDAAGEFTPFRDTNAPSLVVPAPIKQKTFFFGEASPSDDPDTHHN